MILLCLALLSLGQHFWEAVAFDILESHMIATSYIYHFHYIKPVSFIKIFFIFNLSKKLYTQKLIAVKITFNYLRARFLTNYIK